jgi:DNA polymerase kappa
MNDLPIRKIPGIGNVTEQILNGLGLQKCSDIIEKSDDL